MFHEVSWFLLLSAFWVLSVTVGLPVTILIKCSTTCRRKLFSWILVWIASRIYLSRNKTWRMKAFEILKSSVGKRDSTIPLEVMEIGIGEGVNFKFYPENCNLTVLDPNKWIVSYFSKNVKKFSNINYKGAIICSGEDMYSVPDNSFDVVVSTYVLCSCQNAEKVIKEVKRVLKPGGKFVFMEHVKFPNGKFGLFLQRFIRPIWILYSDGCKLDQDTGTMIKRAGFNEVICENILVKGWWMYMAKHEIYGVATK